MEKLENLPLAGMGEGWKKRSALCVAAVGCMGFFLSFLIEVNYGTDPFTFMNVSVSERLGWTFGNWQLLLNMGLLVFVLVTSRLTYLGFGSLANMVLLGYITDFFRFLWARILPESLFTDSLPRAVIFVATLVGFVIAAATYMNAGMGLASYDASVMIIAAHIPKAPFFLVRMVWDYAAILIGFLAGGTPTPGALILAALLGPTITLVGKVMKNMLKA